jgi:hypothetical protein
VSVAAGKRSKAGHERRHGAVAPWLLGSLALIAVVVLLGWVW